MKIAIIFDRMVWGGIERVGINYIKLFLRSGHQVDAYILDPETESIKEELEQLVPVRVIRFSKRRCPESKWPVLLDHKVGIYHRFKFGVLYGGLTVLNRVTKPVYRVKKKYNLAIAFSGHINDLTFLAEKYINSDKKIAWLHGNQASYYFLSPGFFRLYSKIRNLICLSEIGDADCVAFNRKHQIKKKKIYNPIEVHLEAADEKKIKRLKDEFGDFCLMIGRLASDKDQETVIKAIGSLKDHYGIKKNLLLVGDGPERNRLEDLVRDMDLTEQVFFEGIRKDVQNYYMAADIYVHAAPNEGLPTVFLEAMMYDLPIVSTDAYPGAREILGNNECGLIADYNPEQLAERIIEVCKDTGLREKLIEKGKERIKDFEPLHVEQEFFGFVNDIN